MGWSVPARRFTLFLRNRLQIRGRVSHLPFVTLRLPAAYRRLDRASLPRACLMPEASRDHEAVARQLGREPRPFRVAARCPFGVPSVIENERTRNMPTSFWVTCQSLDRAIARLESAGGVRAAQGEVGEETVEEVHARHLARYGTSVAGVREGGHVKCL